MDIIKSKDTQRDNIYRLLEDGEKFRFVCLKVKSVSVSSMTVAETENGPNQDQFLV